MAKITIKNTHSKKRSIMGPFGILAFGQTAVVDQSAISKKLIADKDVTILTPEESAEEKAQAEQTAKEVRETELAAVVTSLKANPNQFDKDEMIKTSRWGKKTVPTVEAILRVLKVAVTETERDGLMKLVEKVDA